MRFLDQREQLITLEKFGEFKDRARTIEAEEINEDTFLRPILFASLSSVQGHVQ